MSGQHGIRGYLVQTLITVLEGLEDTTWSRVRLEPGGPDERFDCIWERLGGETADQIRSTEGSFSKSAVKSWAESLRQAKPGAHSRLLLLGLCDSGIATLGSWNGVEIPRPRPLDISGLLAQTAHLLAKVPGLGLTNAGPEIRECVALALIGKFTEVSAARGALTRDELLRMLRIWVSQTIADQKHSIAVARRHLVDLSKATALTVSYEERFGESALKWKQDCDGSSRLVHGVVLRSAEWSRDTDTDDKLLRFDDTEEEYAIFRVPVERGGALLFQEVGRAASPPSASRMVARRLWFRVRRWTEVTRWCRPAECIVLSDARCEANQVAYVAVDSHVPLASLSIDGIPPQPGEEVEFLYTRRPDQLSIPELEGDWLLWRLGIAQVA